MPIQSLDAQLLLFINHKTVNALFDVVMPALSLNGYLLVAPFLVGLLVWGYAEKNEPGKNRLPDAIASMVIACLAVYLAGHIEHWLKDLIARVRPCRALEGCPAHPCLSAVLFHAVGPRIQFLCLCLAPLFSEPEICPDPMAHLSSCPCRADRFLAALPGSALSDRCPCGHNVGSCRRAGAVVSL